MVSYAEFRRQYGHCNLEISEIGTGNIREIGFRVPLSFSWRVPLIHFAIRQISTASKIDALMFAALNSSHYRRYT